MPLMKCGHTSQGAVTKEGKPVCITCLGITPLAEEIASEKPDLNGRMARCDCGRMVSSSFNLPFFEFIPNSYDRYYCGHDGWN